MKYVDGDNQNINFRAQKNWWTFVSYPIPAQNILLLGRKNLVQKLLCSNPSARKTTGNLILNVVREN